MTTQEPPTARAPIVVGVDGSAPSHQALRWAAQMAQVFDSPLHVVTAWQFPHSYGFASPVPDWDPQEDMREVQDEAIAAAFGEASPEGVTRVLEPGGAAQVLLTAGDSALMIVMGSRGRGGFAGLLLGSVSATVAEHSSCPVLIVHGDQPPPLPSGLA